MGQIYCSVTDAMEMLGGASRHFVIDLCGDGWLEAIRRGRKILITVESIKTLPQRHPYCSAQSVPVFSGHKTSTHLHI